MSAHLSVNGTLNISSSTSASTIYSGAPTSGVYTIVAKPVGGGPVVVGWYDSPGNTLHDVGVITDENTFLKFGPMSTNDILVATASIGDAKVSVFEIY